MEWQSIETAPRDGSFVLLYCPGLDGFDQQRDDAPPITIGRWEDRPGEWLGTGWYAQIGEADGCAGLDGHGDEYWLVRSRVSPSAWAPLPVPPVRPARG